MVDVKAVIEAASIQLGSALSVILSVRDGGARDGVE